MYELAQPAGFFFCGLDLGKVRDFAALVAVEKLPSPTGATYHVRHIERAALGTSYPTVVENVSTFLDRTFPSENYMLALDTGGVGQAVRDLFLHELARGRVQGITSTGDGTVTRGPGGFNVPKRDLFDQALLLLQQRRVKVAPLLRHAALLKRELQGFSRRVTEASRTVFAYDTPGGGHGDCVSALVLALWLGENWAAPGVR